MTAPDTGKPKFALPTGRKKWVIIGGGAAGLLGVLYIARRRAASTAATTTTDDTTDADTSAASDADSATGSPYGLLSQLGATYDASTGQWNFGSNDTTTAAASSNQTWASEAMNFLVGEGYDQGSVVTALSNYLEGIPLNQSQTGIVNAARAFTGEPPTGAPTVIGSANEGQGALPPNFITGDVSQDTAIAASPYVAQAYAAYKANMGSITAQQSYEATVNEYYKANPVTTS